MKKKNPQKTSNPKIKNTKEENTEKILIINVDRDDDIGQKLGISGPIIGLKDNLKLATNFAIEDPEDSDSNCIFAAIGKYKELKKDSNDVEIVTLTGHSRENSFFADKNITLQLKKVLNIFPANAAVFISDGAEDEQVMPIIHNFLPIISTQTVIIRQSKSLESTFYTIKRALSDPFFARIFFGVPAIIILLFVFASKWAWEIVGLVLGVYLLIKGFNLEYTLSRFFKNISSRFSLTRISIPFYLGFLFFLIFSIIKGINLFYLTSELEIVLRVVSVFRAILLFLVLSVVSLLIGSMIDLFYLKKVYLLGKHLFSLLAIFIIGILIDFALQLIISQISLTLFIITVILATILLILINKFTSLFDISSEVSELLVNLPVYSKYGLLLGVVISVDDSKNLIRYKSKSSNVIKTLSNKNFKVYRGKIIV
jgi:putative membrane protein